MAERTLQLFQGLLASSPLAAGQMLIALDLHLGPVREFVVLGKSASASFREALRLIRAPFGPRKVQAGTPEAGAVDTKAVPLLEGREAKGDLTAYVCESGTCEAPVHDLAALKKAVEAWG
jgi:uncharacterized protein YyaL (SSP411 family)